MRRFGKWLWLEKRKGLRIEYFKVEDEKELVVDVKKKKFR